MKQALINTDDALWSAINALCGAEIAELIAKVGDAIDKAEQEAFDDGFDKGWESREALIEVEEDEAYYEGDSGDETTYCDNPNVDEQPEITEDQVNDYNDYWRARGY